MALHLKSFWQFIRRNSSITVINYEEITVTLSVFPDLSIDRTFSTLEILPGALVAKKFPC